MARFQNTTPVSIDPPYPFTELCSLDKHPIELLSALETLMRQVASLARIAEIAAGDADRHPEFHRELYDQLSLVHALACAANSLRDVYTQAVQP